MIIKGEHVLSIDDELKRVLTLALKKYQKDIDEKLVIQKSQLMIALFQMEKGLIQRALRKMNPINKDLLPTIISTEKLERERSV